MIDAPFLRWFDRVGEKSLYFSLLESGNDMLEAVFIFVDSSHRSSSWSVEQPERRSGEFG